MSGKRGNISAAKFIKEKFESFGLKTSLQKFKIRRMNPGPKNEIGDDFTHNIIGVLEGKTERQIVIGAHMDHIGYGPSMSRSRRISIHNGADDNASGTTAVLEIAEAFCKMDKPNHTLVFICFSAEEMGLIGSRYYVKDLKQEERTNIDLMINFDMIGYLKGDKDLIITGAREVPNLSNIINNIDRNYPFDAHPARGGGGGSDHASFGNADIPYAFFHTGTHPYYHTPDDDTRRIDFKGLYLVSKFAFEVANEFDKSSTNTRRVSYPFMNDVHDHGEDHRYKIKFPELKK
jgi:Zn-dependent M28 family amino/carboxypeptidase